MRRIRWIPALAAVAACASAPLERDDRAALDAGEQRLRTSVIAADWAALGDLYADSAVLMPPAAPAVVGRNAILSRFGSNGMEINAFETAVESMDGTRRLAYVRGTYLLTAAPFGSSQPRTETGKYLRVWRRDGPDWHVVADIWNADAVGAPPAAAPQAPPAPARRPAAAPPEPGDAPTEEP